MEINIQTTFSLEKISKLRHNHFEILEFLKKFLISANGEEQIIGCESLLQLIAKVRFNLESINILFPLLYNDSRYKISINVLYRVIVDDIINVCYLFGLINKADDKQNALNNELSIFHKEYLKSTIKALEASNDFENYLKSARNEKIEDLGNIEELIKKENPHLFNENGKWRTNSQIRKTTHIELIKLLNQGDSSFISESKKLEFIRKRNFQTVDVLTALFKYYSQYQHYSPKAYELMNAPTDYDIGTYQRTVSEIIMVLKHLFQCLNLKNKVALESECDLLIERIFESFSE